MSADREHDVRAALQRVWPEAASAATLAICGLGGGAEPRSFLVVAGTQRRVLRLPGGSLPPLLDLATEARAMRAAAAAGLAPAVVAADAAAGLLLTEYAEGPCTPERVREPLMRARIVDALRALHGLEVDLPVYAVGEIAARYLGELDAAGGALDAGEREWARELLERGRRFDADHPPTAFCHTDLAAANILADGAAAKFIDFEYAGRGAPLLDLASFAGQNGLGEDERRQLLAEYYGTAAAAPGLHELDGAIRMLRLLAYFWARVAQRRAPGARVPVELAAEIDATLRQD